MLVTVVGIGMGSPLGATREALEALASADFVAGAPRLIEFARTNGAQPSAHVVSSYESRHIVDELVAHTPASPVVLCSGDVGLYSLAQPFTELVRAEHPEWQVRFVAGVSSLQALAARLLRPWDDVSVVSAHGRDCDVVCEVLAHPSTFFLTGGRVTVTHVLKDLVDAGMGHANVTVAQNLGLKDELVEQGIAQELVARSYASMSCVLVDRPSLLDPGVEKYAGTCGIPDDAFERGDAPMTKREVRCLASSLLRVCPRDVVWDVGSGSGSVAVELACLEPTARVYAVEQDPVRCELINRNRKRFGAYNIHVVNGSAPDALADLPAPNAVFVGGGSNVLDDVVTRAVVAGHHARVVVAAVTLETMTRAHDVLSRLETKGLVRPFSFTQMSCSRSRELGSFHMFAPTSPVVLFETEGVHD